LSGVVGRWAVVTSVAVEFATESRGNNFVGCFANDPIWVRGIDQCLGSAEITLDL
jgi:hypothetical protein